MRVKLKKAVTKFTTQMIKNKNGIKLNYPLSWLISIAVGFALTVL